MKRDSSISICKGTEAGKARTGRKKVSHFRTADAALAFPDTL
jgi:hypothetical protein